MKKFINSTGVLLAILIAAGCDTAPVGPGELVEEYMLSAVNEAAPPQVVFQNDVLELLMTDGRMALFDDETYLQEIEFEQRRDGGETVTPSARICKGTYTSTSSTVVLKERYCDSRTYQATRGDGTLTYEFSDGVVLTWRLIPDA